MERQDLNSHANTGGVDDMETNEKMKLLLDIFHLLPLALEILFPQADLVVTTAHSQDVAAQAPADAPKDGVELECLTRPLSGVGCIRCPDTDRFVL